jgi:hypothetical protein
MTRRKRSCGSSVMSLIVTKGRGELCWVVGLMSIVVKRCHEVLVVCPEYPYFAGTWYLVNGQISRVLLFHGDHWSPLGLGR